MNFDQTKAKTEVNFDITLRAIHKSMYANVYSVVNKNLYWQTGRQIHAVSPSFEYYNPITFYKD